RSVSFVSHPSCSTATLAAPTDVNISHSPLSSDIENGGFIFTISCCSSARQSRAKPKESATSGSQESSSSNCENQAIFRLLLSLCFILTCSDRMSRLSLPETSLKTSSTSSTVFPNRPITWKSRAMAGNPYLLGIAPVDGRNPTVPG